MMPEMDGIETCTELRQLPALEQTIIVFLSARSEDYSQLAGYNAGADDYLVKPIKPKILVSKIKALLRLQKSKEEPEVLELSKFTINKNDYTVKYKNEEVVLPKKEFDLMYLLASDPKKVFKREEILEKVWGNEVIVGGRTIDVHIRKLRERFGAKSFKTIKGVGYKFIN